MVLMKDFFKIPNLLSFSRVVLMGPFIYFFFQNYFIPTIIVMILIVLTDILDGWSSRKLNQVTELGKLIDPVADKICLGIGLTVILMKAQITLVPVFVLIGRDILILIFGSLMMKKVKDIPMSNIFGKLTSLTLSITGILFFIYSFIPEKSLYMVSYSFYGLGSVFIVLSSISYFMKALRVLKK